MSAQIVALEAELQRAIDAFADHDWGEHDPRPWIIGHALHVASGAAALRWVRGLEIALDDAEVERRAPR